ncbi:hypothetical protein J7M23_03510, partial [Candidatus Sumerlaeota bacterium]|nr:hypothetical protein [Candidatus Sumerlaeota bacterium]
SSHHLASKIFPEESTRREQEEKPYWDKNAVMEVAFVLIGIFIIATTVTLVPGTLLGLLSPYYRSNFLGSLFGMIGLLIKLGLGIYLVFGARGVVHFIYKFRTFPAPKMPPVNNRQEK